MAQFVVRNLEEDVRRRLEQRAARNGRSMEEEVPHILRQEVGTEAAQAVRLGSLIASRFRGIGLEKDLPEWRGELPRPATFE